MKKKLNVKLLRKIQKHITEEPRRFFMTWFVVRGKPGAEEFNDAHLSTCFDLPDSVPECGTAACIAGWANILTGAKGLDIEDTLRAAEVLGLEPGSIYGNLFDYRCWPKKFEEEYHDSFDSITRAQVACERIDYLIKTGK